MTQKKQMSLEQQLARRGFESPSVGQKLPSGSVEVQANKLHPLPIGGQDPVHASVPVSLTVELDKDGVIQKLKGSEPTEKSIADAVQYVQTLRDNGQLVEIPQKGAAGDMANKSPFVQGATHEIRRDEKGRRVFQRTRFSVT